LTVIIQVGIACSGSLPWIRLKILSKIIFFVFTDVTEIRIFVSGLIHAEHMQYKMVHAVQRQYKMVQAVQSSTSLVYWRYNAVQAVQVQYMRYMCSTCGTSVVHDGTMHVYRLRVSCIKLNGQIRR